MKSLKMLIKMKEIPMWKIAKQIGVSEMTLYRWMRVYDAEHYTKIKNAVEEIEKGGVNNDENN